MLDEIVSAFGRLPEWLRMLLTRLAMSFAAAVLSSLLMHLAVYAYAYRHGARLPLEGVSFIAFLGGFITFMLSLLSLLRFQYFPSEIRKLRREFFADETLLAFVRRRKIVANVISTVALLIASSLLIALAFGTTVLLTPPSDRPVFLPYFLEYMAWIFVPILITSTLALNFPDPNSTWPGKLLLWAFDRTRQIQNQPNFPLALPGPSTDDNSNVHH
jgi:hypothetical protein